MFNYSSTSGVVKITRDLIGEACKKANTDDVNQALRELGYSRQFEIGNPEIAAIELFRNFEGGDYAALVHLTLGSEMQLYGMQGFHDALEFMKEYVPTIKAMVELAELDFD